MGKKQPRPMPNPGANPGVNPMANMPMGGGANEGAEFKRVPIAEKNLRKAEPALAARLFGKSLDKDLNPFHVLGLFAPPPDEVKNNGAPMPPIMRPGMRPGMEMGMGANKDTAGKYFSAWDIEPPVLEMPGGPEGGGPKIGPGVRPPMPMGVPMPGIDPGGAGAAPVAPWERDALVRFIDADVKPGKTYSYAIQVRIANPNYKQDAKVQAAFLAAIPELADGWVTTPSITIPYDYFLYAVDQQQLDEWAKEVPGKKPAPSDIKLPKEAIPFQIHEWVGTKKDEDKEMPRAIGDWAIAPRQVVHKGERIGVISQVPVPVWEELREAFVVPTIKGDPKKRIPDKLGIRVKLKLENEAPVLVDFSGGKRMQPGTSRFEEDTAVEALIMTPDGKLRVQNSRDDADALQAEAYVQGLPPNGISRQQRWQALQRRVTDLQTQAAPPETPGAPGGLKLPGVPPR
jgi:hypothetical protein